MKMNIDLSLKTESIVIILVLLALTACTSNQKAAVEYGVTSVNINGQELYFKRARRGLDYDLLILSPNKDHCAIENPEADYRFEGFTPNAIYYKVEGNSLQLYSQTQLLKPEKVHDKVKVLHFHMSPSDAAEMSERYKDKGLALLKVDVDQSLTCKR
ncbi:MAG TPA: hypothetical protein VKA60_09645 [Blastocatellia bacterium]|nr:hypothetical protein [Blastocatellia bacterium]